MTNDVADGDYDRNSLAEKYVTLKGLSSDHSTNKRCLMASFDADNVLRFIQRGLARVHLDMPVECALDIGCGEGNICRFLIEEKLAESAIGIDRSQDMLRYAQANSDNDTIRCQYVKADAVTDDLFTVVGKSSPLVVQTYLFPHAESVDQLSRMLSNIASVSCGLFVGLIPNPDFDFTGECANKLLRHGIKFTMPEGKKSLEDGMNYHVTFERNTPHELTLVDYWYSRETFEKLCGQAGFHFLEWVPAEWNGIDENAYLIDLVNSNAFTGFIATRK